MEFKEKLKKYAETIIKVGANVQKDQLVVIRANIEAKDLVRELSEEAYKVGAGNVNVVWRDDIITRQKFEYASIETLSDVKQWTVDQFTDYIDSNAVFISVVGDDPNNLDGLDINKIKSSSIANSKAMKYFSSSLMADKNSWCVVGAPTVAWAKVVFPLLSETEAVNKLWELIFYTSRIGESDSVKDWEEHINELSSRAKYLNEKQFKFLKYTSDKGTNLTIELPQNHVWNAAGSGFNSKGVSFTANIPTEEVFTLPHKDGINGIVYSTKALNYNGNIIDEFKLEFKNGKVVSYNAEKGYDVLKSLLETDEGALSLGEVALVPFDSPISNTNTMFFETLYDENASCHLALGKAYPTCLKDGEKMTEEELKDKGANDSLVHVDFMVGDETLNIVGITDSGNEIPVFTNGNWSN